MKNKADVSASFFRMVWLLGLLKLENESFFKIVGSHPLHRSMKNTIITIDSNIAHAKRLMPASADTIQEEVSSEKIYSMHQIMEKLTYCSLGQLEQIEQILNDHTSEIAE